MINSNFNQPLILKPKPPTSSESKVQHSMLNLHTKPRWRFSKKKIITWVLILILVAGGVWFFKLYPTGRGALTSKQVLAEVEKQMILPTGEEPTITTVVNVDEVKYQPFFMNAEAGDQVIVYSKAKKAILYRPSIKKIIEASSLK